MITRKYYLIQLVDRSTDATFWLRKDGKAFFWNNHGNDKEYKNLGSAIKKARSLHNKTNAPEPRINVVEVTFRPCNPELPDGYYEPVNRVVSTF